MRIGIIDLGTNSVRFDVHQIENDGQTRLLHREKLMIRLGQGVFLHHKLDPHAIQRTLQAFLSFQQTAKLFQAEKIVAFGTSALREATDANSLLEVIRRKTSIQIRVISGEEEAKLIATGILTHIPSIKDHFGLIDIGGGSTEISICWKKKVEHSASFPLGTARLQQVFLKSSPPLPSEKTKADPVLALRGCIKGTLLAKAIAEDWPQTPNLIGSSGTIRALQRILKKVTSDDRIQKRSLSKLVKSMKSMTQAELLLVPGMETKRVDMILAGAILLEECMDALGARYVITTDFSLRDGILNQEASQFAQQKGPRHRFKLEDIRNKARQLGYHEDHGQQVDKLSQILFDRTHTFHQLDASWKIYLSAAALLHDIGKLISPIQHENHSYYMVQNADFLGMEKWESEFIARLCMNQDARSLGKIDLSFTKNKTEQNAFVRLLAILRIADSLDRGHDSNLTIQKVRIKDRVLNIKVHGKTAVDLELLRFEQKKLLFEELFQINLLASAS